MYTLYPTGLDSWINPGPFDTLDNDNTRHDIQHIKLNEAVSGLEAKVGTNNSSDIASSDFRLRNLESGVTGILKTTYYTHSGSFGTGNYVINMDGPPILSLTPISGAITFSTTNRTNNPNITKVVVIRISGDTVNRAISFANGMRVLGTTPTGILANKFASLSFSSYGSTEGETLVGFATES